MDALLMRVLSEGGLYWDRVWLFLLHVYVTTTWDQVMLGICGVTAIRLSQDARPQYQQLAPILGLCGQPFWLYATFQKELWVMFLLCIFYTLAWWKGFKRWYLVKHVASKPVVSLAPDTPSGS